MEESFKLHEKRLERIERHLERAIGSLPAQRSETEPK